MEAVIIAGEIYLLAFIIATLMAAMMKVMMMTLQKMGTRKHPANNE